MQDACGFKAVCENPGETWDTCSPFNWHPTCIKINGESDTTTEDEIPPCLGELSKIPCAFPYMLGNVTLNKCTGANNRNGRLPGRMWCPLLVDGNLEPLAQPGTDPLYEGIFVFLNFCLLGLTCAVWINRLLLGLLWVCRILWREQHKLFH
jgi:hypothetical protein